MLAVCTLVATRQKLLLFVLCGWNVNDVVMPACGLLWRNCGTLILLNSLASKGSGHMPVMVSLWPFTCTVKLSNVPGNVPYTKVYVLLRSQRHLHT